MNYAQVLAKPVPQSKPVSPKQVKNNAGGYSFTVNKWMRFERFLILGSLGGTYYVNAQDLTKQNLDVVRDCLKEDAPRVLNLVTDVSTKGRSFNNDASLLVLALAVSKKGLARQYALANFPTIVRTGSHLFSFANYYKVLGGTWSRSVRDTVAAWYTGRNHDQLAYQVIKYQQRNKWSHRDVLRLAHAKPTPAGDAGHDALFAWLVKGEVKESAPTLLNVYKSALAATTEDEIINLVKNHRLTWEFVPGQWLGSKEVWAALLPNLPMTALVRNLARLTANGLIAPLADDTYSIVERLNNQEAIKKARLHPLSLLNAWKVYRFGRGVKGSLSWTPVDAISDALEDAFLKSFDRVEPTGKRVYWAQDVSGSMSGAIAGNLQVNCAEAGAAMALAFAKSEQKFHAAGFNQGLQPLTVSKRSTFNSLLKQVTDVNFGGTDCALPMLDAMEKEMPVDLFVVCTDNETWAGRIHPHEALNRYRERMGIDAKLVVLGMASSDFTIANPDDPGMLDVVGMDTQVYNLVRQFAGGNEEGAELE